MCVLVCVHACTVCMCIHIAIYNSSPAPQFFFACLHSVFISPVSGLEPWLPQISKIYSFAQKHRFCKLYQNNFQFSRSVVSNSLWPHGLQHARPPCPSPTSETCSNYVHQVSDAIQLSHPLSSPPPPAFSLSQHQGLFQWVSCSHQVAEVLGFQVQYQSFQWIFRTDFL